LKPVEEEEGRDGEDLWPETNAGERKRKGWREMI